MLSKVFGEICEKKNWKFSCLFGRQTGLKGEAEVTLFGHSLIDVAEISPPFVGVHVVRDPRNIIVSGYRYHRHTREKWCINQDFNPAAPITFPRVPVSQQHRSEQWKLNYLQSLNGRSYQENLLGRSQYDGLLFEMEHYGAWTIECMRSWSYGSSQILEVRFEDLMARFDDTFNRIFRHLGYSATDTDLFLDVASRHDLNRATGPGTAGAGSGRKLSDWREYFGSRHKEEFVRKFDDALVELGYEPSNDNW